MRNVATVHRWPMRHRSWGGDPALQQRMVDRARVHRDKGTSIIDAADSCDFTALSLLLRELGVPVSEDVPVRWLDRPIMHSEGFFIREASYLGVPPWFTITVNGIFDVCDADEGVGPQAGWDAVTRLLEALPAGVDIGPVQARVSSRHIRERLLPVVENELSFDEKAIHGDELREAMRFYAGVLEGEDATEDEINDTYWKVIQPAKNRAVEFRKYDLCRRLGVAAEQLIVIDEDGSVNKAYDHDVYHAHVLIVAMFSVDIPYAEGILAHANVLAEELRRVGSAKQS